MDVFEQMGRYIRSIQQLDFFIRFDNKKLKSIPRIVFSNNEKLLHHPYEIMMPRLNYIYFMDRQIDVWYKLSRAYFWHFDLNTADYIVNFRDDYVKKIKERKYEESPQTIPKTVQTPSTLEPPKTLVPGINNTLTKSIKTEGLNAPAVINQFIKIKKETTKSSEETIKDESIPVDTISDIKEESGTDSSDDYITSDSEIEVDKV